MLGAQGAGNRDVLLMMAALKKIIPSPVMLRREAARTEEIEDLFRFGDLEGPATNPVHQITTPVHAAPSRGDLVPPAANLCHHLPEAHS